MDTANDKEGCHLHVMEHADLALAIGDGRIRQTVSVTAGSCPTCWWALVQTANLTDSLLLLASRRSPPVGFSSRVLARIDADRKVIEGRDSWSRRLAGPAPRR